MRNADKIESRVCSMDDKKSKTIIVNICYLNESESKIVHISVNTRKIKDAKNER